MGIKERLLHDDGREARELRRSVCEALLPPRHERYPSDPDYSEDVRSFLGLPPCIVLGED
jgi:hypothetical protein